MKVTIFGPNLNDQSRGQFHVHAAGCGDCKHYGSGRKYGGDRTGWTIEANSEFEVTGEIYSDHLSDFGYEWDSPEANSYIEQNMDDLHFAPCVKFDK